MLARTLAALLGALLALQAGAQSAERTFETAPGSVIRYRLVAAEEAAASARAAAKQLVRHLAAGDIEEAALLSTAPRRRYEVLKQYRDAVGEAEFRRVFARYPQAPIAEIALGERRLLLWKLPQGIAGQYYVRIDGRFLLDDAPSEPRAQLGRLLQAYRAGKLKFSG